MEFDEAHRERVVGAVRREVGVDEDAVVDGADSARRYPSEKRERCRMAKKVSL